MARRLRIQFAGARYHVINRGNLQHDVFATGGAIASFVRTLQAAVGRFQWRLHAFVVMRNHFHLALATPEPNLVAGMHWLQSTFAVRLTRFHRQHGHVFQGRYRSLVIEDDAHLARVCDYIHLNPVRAGVLAVEQLRDYRASSLWYWLRGRSPGWRLLVTHRRVSFVSCPPPPFFAPGSIRAARPAWKKSSISSG